MTKYSIKFVAVNTCTSKFQRWKDYCTYETRNEAMEAAQAVVRAFQAVYNDELCIYYYIVYA